MGYDRGRRRGRDKRDGFGEDGMDNFGGPPSDFAPHEAFQNDRFGGGNDRGGFGGGGNRGGGFGGGNRGGGGGGGGGFNRMLKMLARAKVQSSSSTARRASACPAGRRR